MRGLPVRTSGAKSFLPLWIRDLPYKGKIADRLGVFALLVLALGSICFLGMNGTPMKFQTLTSQDADNLQTLAFLSLGIGQLVSLRRKLPVLLKRKISLFSQEGWYYIGALCALLVVLLFLLYLFVSASHLFMVAISFFAFLLPFTVVNAWESMRDRTTPVGMGERKKLFQWVALLGGASVLMLIGLTSLSGRHTPVSQAAAGLSPERFAGRTAMYDKASVLLTEYSSRLIELDAQLARLPRTDMAVYSRERIGNEIKSREYVLGKILDSLDNRGHEYSTLTAPFRTLLAGHRILSHGQFERSDSLQ